jgi:hypothetical protein
VRKLQSRRQYAIVKEIPAPAWQTMGRNGQNQKMESKMKES